MTTDLFIPNVSFEEQPEELQSLFHTTMGEYIRSTILSTGYPPFDSNGDVTFTTIYEGLEFSQTFIQEYKFSTADRSPLQILYNIKQV